jgi:hypothetical protein
MEGFKNPEDEDEEEPLEGFIGNYPDGLPVPNGYY